MIDEGVMTSEISSPSNKKTADRQVISANLQA